MNRLRNTPALFFSRGRTDCDYLFLTPSFLELVFMVWQCREVAGLLDWHPAQLVPAAEELALLCFSRKPGKSAGLVHV